MGSFDNSSYAAFSYEGSASYSYSNSGSWTSEEGHPEHKHFNESSGTLSASEFYFFSESQTASGSFGTKTNGVNWHDETRTSKIVLSDNWTREDKTKQKYIEDISEWQVPPNYSGSGSGSSDPVLAQTYIRTSETQSHQKTSYEVDTYSLATTRVTQNLNGVTDQTSQQISTTVDHSEGTAVVESYSKSNSGLQVEFYESGSLAKTVDRKDEWVYDYTVNDSYSPTSAQGSKLGSWTHDWTETVTENGNTTTTADNNAQADNDSYEPSGSGGGFHWQAYFHQYQNLRPGNVLPKPPKPNAAPAANAGGGATYPQSQGGTGGGGSAGGSDVGFFEGLFGLGKSVVNSIQDGLASLIRIPFDMAYGNFSAELDISRARREWATEQLANPDGDWGAAIYTYQHPLQGMDATINLLTESMLAVAGNIGNVGFADNLLAKGLTRELTTGTTTAGFFWFVTKKAPRGPLKGWKSSQTWDTAKNSAILRKNMGSAVNAGEDAHHIVASTHRRAADARAILDKYQIDINDAANGVGIKPTGARPAHHGTGLHSYDGIDAVTRRLERAVDGVDDWATGREAVLAELGRIRQQILNGTLP